MTEKQRAFKVGDIVRIPPSSAYGTVAMVRGDEMGGTGVNTDKYHLVYESKDLTSIGRIALGKRYTHEGMRVRDCFFVDKKNTWVGVTVCIRDTDATDDIDDFTTQWHAFSLLADNGTIT